MIRRALVAAAAIVLASPALAQDKLYHIAIVTGQLPGASAESFLPFTQYLSERLPPARFEIVQYGSIEDLLNAADRHSVEFAFSTPAALVEMDLRHDVRPIATVTQSVPGKGAFPWLAAAVFVRADRTELKALGDARGMRVVALSPLALGGWLSALREWRRLGLDEKTDFKSVAFKFSYSMVIADVCSGAADVGVLSAATFADLSRECPNSLRVFAPLDGADPRYPVPESTRLYPEAAFAVLGGVDDRFISELTRELLSIETGSPAARAATVAGFSAPLSYTPVHELMKELHVGPYESYGRLTFAQAAEQHAGKVSVVLLVFVTLLVAGLFRARRLNTRLAASIAERNHAEDMRRRFEEHAQHAQRMDSIGRLAGAVAHDFNNLLTVINGYSELLLLDLPDGTDAETRRSAEQIHRAGRRAAELTQQLLTFSRKQAVHVTRIDLNAVIRDSEGMFRVLLGERIDVSYSLAPDLWPVLGDRTQMHQVLLNLGVNARDAMHGIGPLTITTGNAVVADEAEQKLVGITAGSYAWLEVTDTGTGIDHETLQHIFEPFFSTKGEAGTGLGLATVYGIVKQAGGGIRVTSEPGRGSTFRVFLPRMESVDTAPVVMPMSAPVATSRPLGQPHVMVVEDQDDVRRFAKAALETHGYLVLEAGTGNTALEIATGHKDPIDLLVADVVLGEMSGREVAERVLALHPETRVLFTSGYPDDEIARRGVSSGSVAFLAKPYSAASLAAKVAEILAISS